MKCGLKIISVGAAMKLESLLLATFLQLVQVGIKSGIQKSSGELNQIETSTVVSCHCDCHCYPKLLPFDLSALELGIGLISLLCLICLPFSNRVDTSQQIDPSPRRRGHGVIVSAGAWSDLSCVLQ